MQIYLPFNTNRFSSSVDSNIYRIGSSIIPTTTTAPLTNRKIWKVTANTPVTLGAGTYWIKYQLQKLSAIQDHGTRSKGSKDYWWKQGVGGWMPETEGWKKLC